jgi:organic radical activating enzyme
VNYFDLDNDKKINTQKKMDSISSSFCLVRWKHATLNLATGSCKSCCHHDYKNISLGNEYSNLHDSLEDISKRNEMLNNIRPKDCSQCWAVEDQGFLSDRVNWSAKSWMLPFLEEVVESPSSQASTPSWLELNFSSVCNLKCLYCSPVFSTQWYKEINEGGSYKINSQQNYNDISQLNHLEFSDKYENKVLLEKFWPWFHEILPQLRLLKITGGEPLLSPNTIKMIRLIETHPSKELIIGFNSNLSVTGNSWSHFLEAILDIEKKNSVKKIELFPSIDSFGKRAEYIRSGLDLNLFKNNVEEFLEKTKSSIYFTCTLNNLALGGLNDLLEYVLGLKKKYFKEKREIAISFELIHFPQWLSLNILPQDMDFYLEDAISFAEENFNENGFGFNREEIEGLKRAKSFQSLKSKNLIEERVNQANFLKQIDERRKINRFEVFPELTEFFKNSESI